jgi:general secretion pathway protein C
MAPGLLFGALVEFLFKRHFWIVHLLFIFGVMLMVARTANAFIESVITPLPTGRAKSSLPQKASAALTQLDGDKFAKLTGMPKPVAEPLVKEPTQEEKVAVDLNAAPVHTALRVKLLGTLLAGLPEWSIASIQDVVTLKTTTYMVGDKIQNADILEIERTRVIILNNNRREFIDNTSGDGAAPVVAVAKPVNDQPPPGAKLGEGIKKTGENEFEVPRGEIDKTLSNLNDVAMQARIVPAFKDGVAQGFKLFSIRPDSIYSKIGVQNGDVIKRINGYDLNSPEKALEIYSKLKEANRIDIELDRNGSTVRSTYNVR